MRRVVQVFSALSVAALACGVMALGSAGCARPGDCGEFPGPCIFPTVHRTGFWGSSKAPVNHRWRASLSDSEKLFLSGVRCVCKNPLCSATRAARKRCRGKPDGCVDELRSNAARGYIALLPKPPRFERVDEVLTTNGSLHSVLLNRVPIKLRRVDERLLLTATGPDDGRLPFKWLHVGDGGADADLSVSGIDYVCW